MEKMYFEVIKKTESIFNYPSEILVTSSLTLGDLHGNALKLLYMLIRYGIARISEEEYKLFITIYETPVDSLTKNLIEAFDKRVENIDFTSGTRLRLLGDELSDRGNNDYFTLKILLKLKQSGVYCEILLSNHGLQFIMAYELIRNGGKVNAFKESDLKKGQDRSMQGLARLIEKDLVSLEKTLRMIEEAYLPFLKVIGYSYVNNYLTIFSHAPIGLYEIQALERELIAPPEQRKLWFPVSERCFSDQYVLGEKELNEIVAAFDRMNTIIQERIVLHQLSRSFPWNSEKVENPFYAVIWNRKLDRLVRPTSINFVHGHDSKKCEQGNVYNLDDQLGKNSDKGLKEYTVWVQPSALNLSEVPEKKEPHKSTQEVFSEKRATGYRRRLSNEQINKIDQLLRNYLERLSLCQVTVFRIREKVFLKFNKKGRPIKQPKDKKIEVVCSLLLTLYQNDGNFVDKLTDFRTQKILLKQDNKFLKWLEAILALIIPCFSKDQGCFFKNQGKEVLREAENIIQKDMGGTMYYK